MPAEDEQQLTHPRARRAVGRRVAVVAHRGAPRVARENTLAAVHAALALGVDWIEVDVRLTRCGTPVLLHDATLDRLWAVPRAVADLDVAELAALAALTEPTEPTELTGPAGTAATGDAWAGVPTLREGLAVCAQAGVTVMVDVPALAEGEASLAVVHELGLLDVCVFAGDLAALERIRAASPAARIALSWESFLPPSAALLARVRPQYLNVEHHRLTRPLVAHARRRGLAISTWTVDRPSRMARVVRLGADVVITNDPALALATLARSNETGREVATA
jgi:glycerophosphoryl diester phosphodiesterase